MNNDATTIRWCVGKYFHLKGTTTPMHFMPLHDFHFHQGIDYASLLQLRALRHVEHADLTNIHLSEWAQRSAIPLLANVAWTVFKENNLSELIEFQCGLGLLYEWFKLFVSRNHKTHTYMHYLGITDESFIQPFHTFHQMDDFKYEIEITPSLEFIKNPNRLFVLNHLQAVRQSPRVDLNIPMLLDQHFEHAAWGMRVTENSENESRIDVLHRTPQIIPSLSKVLSMLFNDHRKWYVRYLPGFDSGFFLPTSVYQTGVLLAYCTTRPIQMNQFAAIQLGSFSTVK